MNALTSDPSLAYSSSSPVLIAGSSEAALMRASRTVNAFGLRIGDTVAIDEAEKRLSRQAAASAVWIELDGEMSEAAAATLAAVNRDSGDGRYAQSCPGRRFCSINYTASSMIMCNC